MEQKKARLDRKKELRKRRSSEAELEQLPHQRRAEEDTESRETRLEQMRQNAHQSRAEEDTDTHLGQHSGVGSTCNHFGDLPTFLDQQSVQRKLTLFHSKLANCEFELCTTCNESFPCIKLSKSNECQHCSRDRKAPKLYSYANDMDPGPLPPCLQGLSQVEEMLISPVMPIMSVYRLPLGQMLVTLLTFHKILAHSFLTYHVTQQTLIL